MGIGKTIENALIEKNMSIKELSVKTSVPYNTLYACIKRDSDSLRLDYLIEVLRVLVGDTEEGKKLIQHSEETLKNANQLLDSLENKKYIPSTNVEALYNNFNKLNEVGQTAAVERVEELTHIEKYKK